MVDLQEVLDKIFHNQSKPEGLLICDHAGVFDECKDCLHAIPHKARIILGFPIKTCSDCYENCVRCIEFKGDLNGYTQSD